MAQFLLVEILIDLFRLGIACRPRPVPVLWPLEQVIQLHHIEMALRLHIPPQRRLHPERRRDWHGNPIPRHHRRRGSRNGDSWHRGRLGRHHRRGSGWSGHRNLCVRFTSAHPHPIRQHCRTQRLEGRRIISQSQSGFARHPCHHPGRYRPGQVIQQGRIIGIRELPIFARNHDFGFSGGGKLRRSHIFNWSRCIRFVRSQFLFRRSKFSLWPNTDFHSLGEHSLHRWEQIANGFQSTAAADGFQFHSQITRNRTFKGILSRPS